MSRGPNKKRITEASFGQIDDFSPIHNLLWEKLFPSTGGLTMGQVKFKGNPVNTVGPTLKPGDAAPEFECLAGLEIVKLSATPSKARLFSVVPSLDTPVCSMQTKK